eukprot:scaffold565577_cov17-Prasinocladus_malaysianus.AAC.1
MRQQAAFILFDAKSKPWTKCEEDHHFEAACLTESTDVWKHEGAQLWHGAKAMTTHSHIEA